MMGLFSPGSSSCTAAQAATLICGLVGTPRLAEAITLCLACSAGVIGSSPSPEQAGATGARSALLGAFARVVHGIPPSALELAVVKMAAIATAGFALGQGCGGAIIFQAAVESEPPLPMSRGVDAGLAAIRLINAAAPASMSSPAALTVSASAGAGLSPESALEAEISARRLALDSIRSAKAQLAAGGVAPLVPAIAVAGGAPLCGFAFLRPLSAPPAAPLTDLELLIALGGAEVARRLAASACNLAPLISMAGPGSVATAVKAASDFSFILTAVRAVISSSSPRRELRPSSCPHRALVTLRRLALASEWSCASTRTRALGRVLPSLPHLSLWPPARATQRGQSRWCLPQHPRNASSGLWGHPFSSRFASGQRLGDG